MLYSLEVGEGFTDVFFGNAGKVCEIPAAKELYRLCCPVRASSSCSMLKAIGSVIFHFVIFYVCDGSVFLHGCERIQMSFQTVLCQFLFDDRVIVPEDESVVRCLVLRNTEFGIDVVLHTMVVSVQMVRSDIIVRQYWHGSLYILSSWKELSSMI